MGLRISNSKTKVTRGNTKNTDEIVQDGEEFNKEGDFEYQ